MNATFPVSGYIMQWIKLCVLKSILSYVDWTLSHASWEQPQLFPNIRVQYLSCWIRGLKYKVNKYGFIPGIIVYIFLKFYKFN